MPTNPASETACSPCAHGDHGRCRDLRASGPGLRYARNCGCCYPDLPAMVAGSDASPELHLSRGPFVPQSGDFAEAYQHALVDPGASDASAAILAPFAAPWRASVPYTVGDAVETMAGPALVKSSGSCCPCCCEPCIKGDHDSCIVAKAKGLDCGQRTLRAPRTPSR